MAEWNISKQAKTSLRKKEYAVLVGVITPEQSEEQVKEYLDELAFLALTAGAKTQKTYVQKLQHPDRRTFVGKGKIEEILTYVEMNDEITMVIFDDDLTGKQVSILEEYLKVKIIDRSTLILDIFAERAQTAQAQAQVELAQLQYLLPRLRGLWTHLERQRGGIGMRGPGEKEIETDRRIVRDKISKLKKDLQKIDKQSETQRKNRGQMVRVALVGYTNVGKSTLMNVLSKSDVFAENKLFATLDTTVRKVVIDRLPFLLSDTVGFIRKLPHHLVESFKSTLDETRESDCILHVVDFPHSHHEEHIQTVLKTLKDLNVDKKPTLLVLNKADLYREQFDDMLDKQTREDILNEIIENYKNNYNCDVMLISAVSGENMDNLKAKLSEMVTDIQQVKYPYLKNKW